MPASTVIPWSIVGSGYLVPKFGASTALFAPAIAPTVTLVSPANGATIARAAPVILDVTDDEARLIRVILLARFFSGSTEVAREVVYDGGGGGPAFGPLYTGSTVVAITGGFRFTIVRAGGWPSSPRLRVFAFDTHGEEAA